MKAIDLELSKEASVWNSNLTGGDCWMVVKDPKPSPLWRGLSDSLGGSPNPAAAHSLCSDKCSAQGPDSAVLLGHAEGGKAL